MMGGKMNILQFNKNNQNYVGIIKDNVVHCIKDPSSMYDLSIEAIKQDITLSEHINKHCTFTEIPYD